MMQLGMEMGMMAVWEDVATAALPAAAAAAAAASSEDSSEALAKMERPLDRLGTVSNLLQQPPQPPHAEPLHAASVAVSTAVGAAGAGMAGTVLVEQWVGPHEEGGLNVRSSAVLQPSPDRRQAPVQSAMG